ncbi:hypothetical protein MKK75_31385 [Methylobacterium sp. J-030]|uniref:hypothetical protein n=1 Tax=Methylobacterium sp. J-030 TaxID=2836627 RepID=UPI001FBAACFA|nr:hypothetical protein [Methylobacterium sp. J-030]MCJ2073237.1 hypothetical protein [Methylobacterium sp. J-030]
MPPPSHDGERVGHAECGSGTHGITGYFDSQGPSVFCIAVPKEQREVPMARDHSGGATLTPEEAASVERVRRKRLAEDGCPEERVPAGKTTGDDHAHDDVPESEEPGLIESMRGM